MTWVFETTADEVSAKLKSQIQGKTIVITGVSPNSLGAEAALAIAKSDPKLLVLTARDTSKLQSTVDALKKQSPNVSVRPVKMDLSSFASIREAAKEINSIPGPINVLINNAGVMAPPYEATADGHESQFGVNHLGHFLFTKLLFPKIVAAGSGARIVNVSSSAYNLGDIQWEDAGFSNGEKYNKWAGYGQAKTANILFSRALAQKGKAKGIQAFSLHPGVIGTGLARSLSGEEVQAFVDSQPGLVFKSLQQGSATHLVAAFDPELASSSGEYLEDGNVKETLPYAADLAAAEKLWALSEKLVGEKFEV